MKDCDFTKDTEGFWNANKEYVNRHIAFITRGAENSTNGIFNDPDLYSLKLYQYHQAIWNKRPLPNQKYGEFMNLQVSEDGKDWKKEGENWHGYIKYCLTWKDPKNPEKIIFRFGSDIIVTSFIGCGVWRKAYDENHQRCKKLFKQVIEDFKGESNYQNHVDKYTHDFYSGIGGFTIFPRMANSINMIRGRSPIYDRFDLTLECIRIYYLRQKPTYENYKEDLFHKNKRLATFYQVLEKNAEFFDLFGDFQGYVEFFCLDGMVELNDTYPEQSRVKSWFADGTEEKAFVRDQDFNNPVPKTVKEYKQWMNNQLDFVEKRTKQIKKALQDNN